MPIVAQSAAPQETPWETKIKNDRGAKALWGLMMAPAGRHSRLYALFGLSLLDDTSSRLLATPLLMAGACSISLSQNRPRAARGHCEVSM
jgi:hypothetical protein